MSEPSLMKQRKSPIYLADRHMQQKNFSLPRAAIIAAVLGFFAATVTYTGSENLARVRNVEEIIVIHPQELPVTYRGASINGEWYSPSDTVIRSDGWEINWDEVTITAK